MADTPYSFGPDRSVDEIISQPMQGNPTDSGQIVPEPMHGDNSDLENTESTVSFQGEAEAILAVSTNADDGIKDLVDAYKSSTWDDPAYALNIVEQYANKLREKTKTRDNLLTTDEALEIAPVKPKDVNDYIDDYEKENLTRIPGSTDPLVRAYKDMLIKGVEDVATRGYQENNNADTSLVMDKVYRGLDSLAGAAKLLGVEKDIQRNLRADSNDTFTSTLASGASSILTLPLSPFVAATNVLGFGEEQYNETRNAGGSVFDAATAATIEGANQALDVLTDKIFLGTKGLKLGKFAPLGNLTPTGRIGKTLVRAGVEGAQEIFQNKVDEYADFVGLDKKQRSFALNKQDLYAGGAGALIGGGVQVAQNYADSGKAPPPAPGVTGALPPGPDNTVTPAAAAPAPQSLADQLGLSKKSPFPETLPPHRVAVVGEPAAGNAPIETVEQASEPQPIERESAVAITDAEEAFLSNDDGTTTRIVDGAKKQAHTDAVIITPETAQKVAELQAQEPGGIPVIIQTDDLARPYINHPNVGPDLVIDETIVNPDPVMIPVADTTTGHVLQTSERTNVFNSQENSASVSQGKLTILSPTQEVKESTVADRLRDSDRLNPSVKRLLELDNDPSARLSYVSDTTEGNLARVNAIFARFDNNYLEFANDISQKTTAEFSAHEGVAAAFAAEALAQKADSVREADPESADLYDSLSANMAVAYAAKASESGANLELFKHTPFSGRTLVTNARVQAKTLALAKAAEQSGRSLREVQEIALEDKQLDKIEEGFAVREQELKDLGAAVEERYQVHDIKIQALEQEATRLETATSPEVAAIDAQLQDLERADKVAEEAAQSAQEELAKQQDALEEQAKEADKAADDLENSVQEFENELAALDQEIAAQEKAIQDLQKAPIEPDTKNLQALEQKKKDLGCK